MVFKRRNKLFKFAVDLYIELLEQVTKKQQNVKCNDIDKRGWDAFMDHYNDNVGEEFIRKFAQYGFQSWFNDGSDVDYSKRIRFGWVFGMAAIKRWNALGAETNVYITRTDLKVKNKINNITTETKFPELLTVLRPAEEKFKESYLNTQKGMAWCMANTTLYFHKSSNCVVCKFKCECKKVLKENYPKVNKLRGYDE